MQAYDGMYLDGAWRPAAGTDTLDVTNPADGSPLGTVPAGDAQDVDAAVAAARAALPGWAATPPSQRAARIAALRDLLAAQAEDLAATITEELGSPLTYSHKVQVAVPIAVATSFAELAAAHRFEERVGTSRVRYEPVGVVAAITPWNYPLHQIVAKVVAALAAGCTVVLKPAEDTPLIARRFAAAVHDAGFPAGAFNMVTGRGPIAGQALAEHPGVDMISFTGSTEVGRRIGAIAGGAIKPVALELGGKSANVILPGADLNRAVRIGVAQVMANSGQTCSAWTRMLVDAAHYQEAVERAAAATAGHRPGDPRDPMTRVGPLVSAAQRARVTSYLQRGLAEGAEAVAGGPGSPDGLTGRDGLADGYFVRPTVFAGVRSEMAIAQQEIFGPVLCVLPYEDVEDAVRLANDTVYGLAGAVWAADEDTAVAFARRMEAGQVDINGGRFNPLAPFGGYKQSGVGRELGRLGLEEYLQPKSLQM